MTAYHDTIIKLAQATDFYSTWHAFDNKMRLGSREEYLCAVGPRDTRPQAARTLQVHLFELGPKRFQLNKYM